MRIYTVHVKPGLDAHGDPWVVLVKEGFSWPAFFLAPGWALMHRLWLGALAYVALMLVLSGTLAWAHMGPATDWVALLLVQLYVGAQANDWRRWTLARAGYRIVATVLGSGLGDAERRFFSQSLGIFSRPTVASANIGT